MEGWIDNLQNKDSSLISNAHEIFSMDVAIPKILISSCSSSKANQSIGTIA
jgi:hypothetical protein